MPESKNTVLESTAIGALTGMGEVGLHHPLMNIKFLAQNGQPLTLNPSILYRGIGVNIASMVPITAFQVASNNIIQKTFFKKNEPLSDRQKILTAFFAGGTSSIIGCPAERAIIWQAKTGYSLQETTQYILSQSGVKSLFTGWIATFIRDGVFTSCFLGIAPALKKIFKPYCSDNTASVASGTLAGLGATIASHGVDTIKTVQQSSNPSILIGFKEAARKIKKENGIQGFSKGIIPRGIRVVSAVNVMSWSVEKLEAALHNYKKSQKP